MASTIHQSDLEEVGEVLLVRRGGGIARRAARQQPGTYGLTEYTLEISYNSNFEFPSILPIIPGNIPTTPKGTPKTPVNATKTPEKWQVSLKVLNFPRKCPKIP